MIIVEYDLIPKFIAINIYLKKYIPSFKKNIYNLIFLIPKNIKLANLLKSNTMK